MQTTVPVLKEAAAERSTYRLRLRFTDEAGSAVVPSSASWTLRDGLGAVVNNRSNVAIGSLADTVDVVLTNADLQLYRDRVRELRFFTVQAVYGAGKRLTAEVGFWVVNLRGAN